MAQGIGDGFFNDPEDDVFGRLFKIGLLPLVVEVNLQAGDVAVFLQHLAQGGFQGVVGQGSGPHLVQGLADPLNSAFDGLGDLVQLGLGRLRVDIDQDLGGVNPSRNPGQGVANRIVNVAGDSLSFPVLGDFF